jgi:hypothetical protein
MGGSGVVSSCQGKQNSGTFRSVQNGTATCEIKLLAPAGTLASLTYYVTPRQTEATEGHTKQHRSDATVGNPRNAWAEEHPFGEATPATETRNMKSLPTENVSACELKG